MPKVKVILPDNLFNELTDTADRFSVDIDNLIETAVCKFLDDLNRAEYEASFKKASTDTAIIAIAEEGLDDYLNQWQP